MHASRDRCSAHLFANCCHIRYVRAAFPVIILLTPIQFGIKDGGTTTYFSLIYQITIHHAHVDFDEPSDVLYVLEGTTVRILLIPIYDHTYLVTYKDGEPVDVDMPKTDLPGIYRGALDDLSTILASR